LKPIPPQQHISTLGIEKSHMVHRGTAAFVDLMFNQEVLDKMGGVCGGIVVVQLPVTSLP
jgi:hypothetical protein